MELPYLLDKVWIFPALMAGSFLVILFFGKRLPEKATAAIGITTVTICFVMSLFVGGQWISRVNNPPTGAAMLAAEQACNVAPAERAADASSAETPETHGATETPVVTEAPSATQDSAGFAEGESAAGRQEGVAPTGASTPEPALTSETPTGGESASGGEHAEAVVVPVCKSVTWMTIGDNKFEAGTLLDGLSAMMLFTVSLISMLVHWYSTEYLHEDRRFTHYYAFLSLFTASMLFYVLGTNTLQMLVGWELVGVCSFALIGHWWEEKNNSDAALKAFLTNRVGDVGLILGVTITFFAVGGKSFNVLFINDQALHNPAVSTSLLMVGVLCLFGGVTSKSGQFPLHTWLPDAMAGPTPVSALIHAATMVVAGVYLVARLYGAFFVGLHINVPYNYVAIAGGLTTLVGGTLAFVQVDLKKVLAYSTISQLGYMVMGLGVGAWTGATFHLFTHAMFKACLFLGAGSVSHACHHTFDMREMGGLRKKMPITFVTFTIGSLALAGIPFMAGFWSKDEILSGAYHNQYYFVLAMGVATALMTAAYSYRAWHLTFMGEYRGHAHPHESPKVITVPLMVLAGMAILLVGANLPKVSFLSDSPVILQFEKYVQPTFAFPAMDANNGLVPPPFTAELAILSIILAVAGISLMYIYLVKGLFKGMTEKAAPARFVYTTLVNKYYLDVLYTDIIVGAFKGPIARAMYWINMNIIDKVVVGAGVSARLVGGFVYKYIDQGVVDTVVNASGAGAEGGGQFLRRSQSGKVQQYASLLFGGAVAFALILIIAIQLSSSV